MANLHAPKEGAAAEAAAFSLPETAISRPIDALVRRIGEAFSWIWAILIVLIVGNVVLRYAIGTNFVALEELQWHLYAIGFMMGLSYTLLYDGHVRVDVVAEKLSHRGRAWVELVGLLLFLAPFVYVVIMDAIPFVERAWRLNETSPAPGGLPARWVSKAVIIVAFGFLGLAAFSRLSRVTAFLFGTPRPRPASGDAGPT
ncbi:TRAP transporter small permease subunit [Salinarimonas ramus]|uniref:TRAP transporter small permease protein n=1 Tax=Salinarimonas ramus TaxID=690164 RepID=A0A917QJ82_9HYPH|nr:TRAP transporter small permease subunit [Salinarimonas ramus]GGK53474.1 C4-dicarboxylate ABC transporter substrate-binding protein [Salinarimonas ramus]